MKKFYYLLLLLVISASTAFAQEAISKKQITGNWKMVSIETGGLKYDLAKDAVISFDTGLPYTPQEEADFKAAMSILKGSYLNLDAVDKFVMFNGADTFKGKYELFFEENINYLKITPEAAEGYACELAIIDGQAYVTYYDADGGAVTMIYSKG